MEFEKRKWKYANIVERGDPSKICTSKASSGVGQNQDIREMM